MTYYFYPAEIVIKSYIPDKLKLGMFFINRISVGTLDEYIEVYMLDDIPEDTDNYMSKNGCPVEFCIVDSEENNTLLANHDNLAYFDDCTDEEQSLSELSLQHLNYIFQENEGYIEIAISGDLYNKNESIYPVFINNKAVIRNIQEYNEEEE